MFTASTEIVYVPAFSNNALLKLYSGAIVDSTNVSFKYTLYDSAPSDASHENLNDASSVPVYANPVTATGTFTSSSVDDDDEFDSSFFVESVSSFFVEVVFDSSVPLVFDSSGLVPGFSPSPFTLNILITISFPSLSKITTSFTFFVNKDFGSVIPVPLGTSLSVPLTFNPV